MKASAASRYQRDKANGVTYKRTTEQIRQVATRQRRKNRQVYNTYQQKYQQRYRKTEKGLGLGRVGTARYRAKLRSAIGTHTPADIKRLFDAQEGRCIYCEVDTLESYDVDHITPLSKGGRNDVSNLIIACPSCNRSKNDRDLIEWLESVGFDVEGVLKRIEAIREQLK